jgi:hypothetical protein
LGGNILKTGQEKKENVKDKEKKIKDERKR